MSYDFTNTYTDQEGVVWDWKYAKTPCCNREAKPEDHHFTPMTSFLCPHCGVMYDEPMWDPPDLAFITCISDDQAKDDLDPEIQRRYREYHGIEET